MVFSGLPFLYIFLPGTLILYFVMPEKGKNWILLISSLVFYLFGGGYYIFLMISEILLTYVTGRIINRFSCRKTILTFFVIIIIAILCVFKYSGFKLPIGISFYSFQCISYVTDVYRKTYPEEKNIIRFSTYISFFPQLIAGPIVRYDTVKEALKKRSHSFERFAEGIFRFTIGLGKKVLIADRLFDFVTQVSLVSAPSVVLSFTESFAFLLYVYFDFSGYSDMALGLAGCFGFDIPENFEYPIFSPSLRQFFRRWHISLGSWFRDYVYIPLGGNREGILKQIINLMIVWILTGFWHGYGWNYVLWGAFFGIFISMETLIGKSDRKKVNKNPMFTIFNTIFVVFFAVMVFVWFRFTDLHQIQNQYIKMFRSPFWTNESAYYLKSSMVILLIACLGATPVPKKLLTCLYKKVETNHKTASVILTSCRILYFAAILITVTAYLVDGSFSPFLYFQF